jgi:hypothetical protein
MGTEMPASAVRKAGNKKFIRARNISEVPKFTTIISNCARAGGKPC